jgi:beta-glucosidase
VIPKPFDMRDAIRRCDSRAVLNACIGVIFLVHWHLAPAHEASSTLVGELLAQLTVDEKLALTQGGRDPAYLGQAGYVAGVPRLKIPPLRFADGPVGILNRFDTTALPQAICLASTFDPELAGEYGTVLGREARATGMDVVLGPMVNIARVPNWGRNITSFGEDPLLASRLVGPEIDGIQRQGAMATTKHFVANNQSDNAGGGLNNEPGYDFVVDPRTLHEIYLPAFEAAARAGSAAMMAAYNHINGAWNTDSSATLTGILRDEVGWTGFIMSDWHANHATVSLAAGLDLEMPGLGPVQPVGIEPPYWGEKLKAAIASGSVGVNDLDRAVARILMQMERLGMLDGRRMGAPDHIDIEADAAVARKIATAGAVLLTNDGILPLATDAAEGNLVIIGPTARQIAVGPGGGRSEGFSYRLSSPLEAMRFELGRPVAFAMGEDLQGVAIPPEVYSADSGIPGLIRSSLDGVADVHDRDVDFTAGKALPAGRRYRWRASIQVPESGEYLIATQSWGGSTELSIDGVLKATSARLAFGNGVPHKLSSLLPTTDGLDNGQTWLKLEQGRQYRIELLAQAEADMPMQVRLAWVTPAMRSHDRAEAVAAARSAHTAIVFAWARGGEGFDANQNLSLPDGQDDLIAAVAAANPNTIVVLNTGNPVTMPWKANVRAILEMWFPGQEGGWATADLLTGRANPAGRLPITFPKSGGDTPALAADHPERVGKDGHAVIYSEGIFIGYRYADATGREPLFAFGHGLSYTRFGYSDLKIKPTAEGASVSFVVRNTGGVGGTDTPQVYVGPPSTALPVAMAKKVLAGFTRVTLEPGEAKHVSVDVDRRQMSYWSASRHGWVLPAGKRTMYLAASARGPWLEQTVDIGTAALGHP